jgi:uncharacterized protein (TIGR04255 family)
MAQPEVKLLTAGGNCEPSFTLSGSIKMVRMLLLHRETSNQWDMYAIVPHQMLGSAALANPRFGDVIMPWRVDPKPHQVFTRNPLATVICQLKFHPILKVPERVSAFQDRVREFFPVYQEAFVKEVSVNLLGQIELKDDRQFHFQKPDQSCTIVLTTTSLNLEASNHAHKDVLLGDAKVALGALREVCGTIAPLRLGLRYVNIIDEIKIAADLQRGTSWNKLISDKFLSVPGGLADIDDTRFAAEITSKLPEGHMTLRYGLIVDPSDSKTKFKFDIDRYADAGLNMDGVDSLLARFAEDSYSLFAEVIGEDLRTWMEPKPSFGGEK